MSVVDPSFARAPRSSGPLADLARLEVSAPAAARPGSEITVRATLAFSRPAARMISVPSRSALLVLDGERIVAAATHAGPARGIPLTAAVGRELPAQAVPPVIALVTRSGHGGAAGTPLAAGSYSLVAVLAYRRDSLNSAVDGPARRPPTPTGFELVSDPVPIRVE